MVVLYNPLRARKTKLFTVTGSSELKSFTVILPLSVVMVAV